MSKVKDKQDTNDVSFHQKQGFFGYRIDSSHSTGHCPRGPSEIAEKIEQLRALESGMKTLVLDEKNPSAKSNALEGSEVLSEFLRMR